MSERCSCLGLGQLRGLRKLRSKVHSLAASNGRKFALHKPIAKALNTTCYFAHAYAAWRRATSKNSNGLLHRYFLKGADLANVCTLKLKP